MNQRGSYRSQWDEDRIRREREQNNERRRLARRIRGFKRTDLGSQLRECPGCGRRFPIMTLDGGMCRGFWCASAERNDDDASGYAAQF